MTPIVAQAVAKNDRYRTLLRKSLEVIYASDTLPNWLAELEACIADPDSEPGDKLEANAILVGVLSVMIEKIEVGPR